MGRGESVILQGFIFSVGRCDLGLLWCFGYSRTHLDLNSIISARLSSRVFTQQRTELPKSLVRISAPPVPTTQTLLRQRRSSLVRTISMALDSAYSRLLQLVIISFTILTPPILAQQTTVTNAAYVALSSNDRAQPSPEVLFAN